MFIFNPNFSRKLLRSEIEKRLKIEKYTLTKLSELTQLNQANLSGFLHGNPSRTLMVAQLDAIGNAFKETPGWLYDLYIAECFPNGKVSRRRVCPFLIRCAELGRHDCIKPIVSTLLEQRKNIGILFYVAEELFQKGKLEESAYFYRLVIDNEKDSYSRQYVMSHYRLFRTLQDANMEESWKAVVRFEPYRKRLTEYHQLDALLQLVNISFTLRKWKEVQKYGDELRKLAAQVYQNELSKLKNNPIHQSLETDRNLIDYYGQGYLLKTISLEKQGLYEQAKEFVSGFADVSWFNFLDKSEQAKVDRFKILATANRYKLDILMGDISILTNYITFLEDHPTEILSGLVAIMKATNQHGFVIDHILERFSPQISSFHDSLDPFDINHHLEFRYQVAFYHYQHERYEEGIINTLRCLDLAIVLNDQTMCLQGAAMFERYRYYATSQHKREYKKLMEEVRKIAGRIPELKTIFQGLMSNANFPNK